MSEFVQSWKNTKAYTLAVAEAMPAESYSFKPAAEEMTFAGQMIHISHANYAWFAGVLGEKRVLSVSLRRWGRAVNFLKFCVGADAKA